MSVLLRIATEPFRARTWRETGFLLLGVVTGAIAFTVIVAGLTAGSVMALTILGLPVVLAVFVVFRFLAGIDRRRAKLVRGSAVPAVYRTPRDGRILSRLSTGRSARRSATGWGSRGRSSRPRWPAASRRPSWWQRCRTRARSECSPVRCSRPTSWRMRFGGPGR